MNKNYDELIAKFTGFTHEKNLGWYDNEMILPQHIYDNIGGNCFDELLFSKSWDWIISILRKIDELEYELPDGSNLIGDITYGLVNLDIEIVYERIINFINWYNKQNLK